MIVLLETSTKMCSVALVSEQGDILAKREKLSDEGYEHDTLLHQFIDEVLQESKVSSNQLTAIGVSAGPGSYTGLRIGVAAAKGMCYTLQIPLFSVDTLLGMTNGISQQSDYYIPLLDARRMEVYNAVFDSNKDRVIDTAPHILTQNSYLDYLEKGNVCFFGDGVSKWKDICTHPNATFVSDFHPKAEYMCQIILNKLSNGDSEDIAYYEPNYLKEFRIGGK